MPTRAAALLHRAQHRFPRAAWMLRRLRTRAQRVLSRKVIEENRRPALENEIWVIDELTLDGGVVRAAGWLLPPPQEASRIALNGKPFEWVQSHSRPDVADDVWQRERAGQGGFVVASRIEGAGPFAGEGNYLRISYENAPTKPREGLARDFFLLDPAREAPLPSQAQRARVIGSVSELGFRLSGATDLNRLRAALEVVAGRPLASFASVLDWGVGCGRVARYALREVDAARFHGCDIDADNVAWCQSNLRGSFHRTDLAPPLPFDTGAFDLVYGVSVFTHLRETLQDEWLAELRRILRPGGFALVTTHGRTALDFSVRPSQYAEVRDAIAREGLVVRSNNYDLDGAVSDPGAYVNVFHGEDYVRRHWARWLDVVAVIPGYIHTHDLVVLRRPLTACPP